jgi:hypothetical protein
MSFVGKQEISRKTIETFARGREVKVTYAVYKTCPKPYKLLTKDEVLLKKKKHEFEPWEDEDDLYILSKGCVYNLDEFLAIGFPTVQTNGGKMQLAGGDFLIGLLKGRIYAVSYSEKFEYEKVE